jgi:hypothetical protein
VPTGADGGNIRFYAGQQGGDFGQEPGFVVMPEQQGFESPAKGCRVAVDLAYLDHSPANRSSY